MGTRHTAHVDSFARDGLPPSQQWPKLTFELPELRYPDRLNAGTKLLDEMVPEFGDRPCVHTPDGAWTYAGLAARSNRIAAVLVEDMGLVPGNRVLLRAPNTPELIATWFAVLKAGGVAVTTMPMLRPRELAGLLDKAQISHALVDARVADDLLAAQEQEAVLRHVLSFGPGGELEARIAGKPDDFAAVETASDDVALIAFTSGTTGKPKGCIHFHRDLLSVCDTVGRHILSPGPDDVVTGTPPLGFTFGLGALVLFPMRFGASTVPIERPSPAVLFETIRARGITMLFTAPTGYRALLREAAVTELSSLRTCVAGGETLPAATFEAWLERTGIRILDGLGSTEMLHTFISARAEDARPGATGRPVPGYEAIVVGDDMRPLPIGHVGRLAVRGPTGCRYLTDARQTDYVVGGWNITGDAYLVDDDGYFRFQARTDDMIISSGYNIPGPEVEAALLEHPAVHECAVVASPDGARGNVVKAYVVVGEGATAGDELVAELQDHVRARIAPYKYPRRIAFVDALPKTQTGKIQRSKLREFELRAAGARE